MSRQRKKTEFIWRDDRRFRLPAIIFVTLLLIFFAGLCSAVSYAHISNLRSQIRSVRIELQAQKEANAVFRAEITQRYTPDEIERIAVERLGMHRPDASQIIHINVPKQNYAVFEEEIPEIEEQSFWESLARFFQSIVEVEEPRETGEPPDPEADGPLEQNGDEPVEPETDEAPEQSGEEPLDSDQNGIAISIETELQASPKTR